MGRVTKNRLVRKRHLERILAKIKPHPSPKAYLEQYTTPPNIATEMLYMAAYSNHDIINKSILDLGCGTGRLSIGAALLGAKEVTGEFREFEKWWNIDFLPEYPGASERKKKELITKANERIQEIREIIKHIHKEHKMASEQFHKIWANKLATLESGIPRH